MATYRIVHIPTGQYMKSSDHCVSLLPVEMIDKPLYSYEVYGNKGNLLDVPISIINKFVIFETAHKDVAEILISELLDRYATSIQTYPRNVDTRLSFDIVEVI